MFHTNRRLRILIVDDFAPMRSMLRRIIEKSIVLCHSEVVEASSADAAVAAVKVHMPHIILLDVSMPGRDGIDAIQDILRIDPQAKIIMVSASSHPELVQRSVAVGAKDFIVKPFHEERLLGSIRQHFHLPHPRPNPNDCV